MKTKHIPHRLSRLAAKLASVPDLEEEVKKLKAINAELLEALKSIQTRMPALDPWLWDKITTAIAKATQ